MEAKNTSKHNDLHYKETSTEVNKNTYYYVSMTIIIDSEQCPDKFDQKRYRSISDSGMESTTSPILVSFLNPNCFFTFLMLTRIL